METITAQALIDKHRSTFDAFAELLVLTNQKYNLTAITDKKEIDEKHFLDSVAGADLFPENARVVEVGSGGGFPSLPVSIVRPDLSFTLVEATGKKCEFLKQACETLGLSHTVLCARAEDIGRDPSLRESFDVCCARAVARLNTLCEYCLPLVKVGGIFIAYKGESGWEELNEAQNAVKTLGGKVSAVQEIELPSEGAKRKLIVIQKIRTTPEKYPRENGAIRKHPL